MATVTTPDGVSIAITEQGSGPTVLLVHGITESSATWGPVPDLLADAGYRVVSMDLRGHGGSGRADTYDLASMAGDVGAVLADLDAVDALVIGHSLGGAVVSAYAAGGPCRAVVNVDQPLALSGFQEGLRAVEPMLRGTREEFEAVMAGMFEQMRGGLDDATYADVAGSRRLVQDVVLGVWDLVLTASAAELDAVVEGVAGAVTVPYLALHGLDPGPDYAAWLTSLVPSASVEVWDGLGHHPHRAEPQRFVERVRAFDPAVPT